MPTSGNRASDLAYESLKTWIIRGEFSIGQPLDLVDLQSRLGVGRTPLREALQRLAENGLVNVIPNRGTFINQVSLSELKLLMEARMELEAACARMVALNPDPKILAQLEQMVGNPGDFVSADDGREPVYALDEMFHPLFYAATGNPFMRTALLRLFYSATVSASMLGIQRFSSKEIQDDFRQLLTAVRARDPDAAAETMRRHISAFRYRIAEQFLGREKSSGPEEVSRLPEPSCARTQAMIPEDRHQ